jgi:hypothetical protein
MLNAVSKLGAVLVVMSFAATAGADTTTNYHIHGGQVCQPGQGSESRIVYVQSEGVKNIHTTSTATLYCPVDTVVVKVNTDNPISYKAIRVRVLDRNTSTNITCTLKSYTQTGQLSVTYSNKSSTGSSNSIQTIEWLSSSNTFFNNHTFRVSCTLPLGTSSTTQSAIVQVEAETFIFTP